MGLGALALALGLVALVAGLARLVRGTGGRRAERAVLPSHYAGLVHADPASYPGHCTACGTDNEPGYRFCEHCGSEIPSSETDATADVRWIFEE